MHRSKTARWVAAVMALGLVAAACGDDSGDSADTTAAAADTTAAEGGDTTAAAGGDTTAAEGGGGAAESLADVCPETVVVQTDWFPESEHGAMYEMMGDDYEVDKENKIVRGSLVAGGEDTGVDIEIRSGGPAIGFQQVTAQMYSDPDITVGYVSTDEAVANAEDNPTVAVVSPLEKNPQIIMWDPATYPDVKTIADLGTEGVTVNHFAGAVYVLELVGRGILNQDQLDPSYDGSPARFISEGGKIAQQGFASAEPYNYENVFEDWGKPVSYELIHDAGLQVYSQAIAVRKDALGDLSGCMEKLVPIIQQAQVDFINNPDRTNAIIIDAVAKFGDFWVYDEGVANYSVETQKELGLVGNGEDDDTLGNFDLARVQDTIDKLAASAEVVDLNVPDGLTPEDIVTNEFIDQSIGL